MVIIEYQIKCPSCNTETRVVTEDVDPMMFQCKGCGRSVVMQNNSVYTVSEHFTKRVMNQHRVKPCGQLIAHRISEKAKELVNKGNINNLHDLLNENMDVNEFIKRLG